MANLRLPPAFARCFTSLKVWFATPANANHLPVVGSADSSGSHRSDNNPDGVSPEKIRLFNASDGEPLPVAEDPGFDVILLGDCVFTRWEDKHTDTTPRSDHIFQVGG
jgi:hypothetical protein